MSCQPGVADAPGTLLKMASGRSEHKGSRDAAPTRQAHVDLSVVDEEFVAGLDPHAVTALSTWQQQNGAQVRWSAWLGGGYTDAKVAAVVVDQIESGPQKVILKRCPPDPALAREPERHEAALQSGPPAFVSAHLVAQPYAPCPTGDGGWLMFQGIAGGNLQAYRPLASLYNNAELPDAVGILVRSLLTEWTEPPHVLRQGAREIVLEQLGRRGTRDGNLERWAAGAGASAAIPWLRFEEGGAPLPNPLAWLFESVDSADDHVMTFRGRTHGDLHLDNVLVQMTPQVLPETFQLIDLSSFADSAMLAQDPAQLLLATFGKHLPELPITQRRALMRYVSGAISQIDVGGRPLQIAGLVQLADAILLAGDDWAGEASMLDDWHLQLTLGIIGSALTQSAISVHTDDVRWWFFELAATCLAARARGPASELPSDAPLVGPGATQSADLALAARTLDDLANGFDGRRTVIAVVTEDGLAPPDVLSRQPWDLVVEFDRSTDLTGAYAHRPQVRRPHRLVSGGQEAVFARPSTVWLAADGLQGSATAPTSPRAWRQDALPSIKDNLERLARSSSRSACLCVLGAAGPKARAVAEGVLDAFRSRVELVCVTESETTLDEYEPVVLAADPVSVLQALPPRDTAAPASREATLPGSSGPVAVPQDRLSWLGEAAEVLHSRVGLSVDRDSAIAEGFYRGEQISWLELDLGVDLARPIAGDLLERVTTDLASRTTRRILLRHYPGAGGTTLARRIAWDVHWAFPTIVAGRVTDPTQLIARVREINALADNAVFLVIESTLDSVVDAIFSALRADSVSTVILIVARYAGGDTARDGDRSFYLSELRKQSERTEFANMFAERAPERYDQLMHLATVPGHTAVPFLFGLTAFEDEYTGLPAYVERTLDDAAPVEREALKLTALVHRYTGSTAPAVLLAEALHVPFGIPVDVGSRTTETTRAILVEESEGEWRTTHRLVAEELLAQLLTPVDHVGPRGNRWKQALSALAIQLITQAADEFGAVVPTDIRAVLDELFINRGTTAMRGGTFSELLSDIPSLSGRIEVLRALAHAFPEIPHFWAHFGRLLSYEADEFTEAMEAITRAISLSPDDDALYHMRGMVLRKNARAAMRERTPERGPASHESHVLALVAEARVAFERAIELNDASDYGHVALIQLCIDAIEFGKRSSGDASYAAFLAQPRAEYYRDLLGRAEESLDGIREIRGGDQPSPASARVEADLLALYDDFAALLEGWRNLLDRPNQSKPPIRRRIVRAYLARSSTWRDTPRGDRLRVITLLSENLRDNPQDTRSLLEWLRVARFESVSLDRAAELVSYSSTTGGIVPRDVAYYDYVLSVLLALEGRESAAHEARNKLERSRDRAAQFGNRRHNFEWYTSGNGLGQLVHHGDLRGWQRSARGDDPALLSRLAGRVGQIARPQSGFIEFGPGLRAFFAPGGAGLVAGRDENVRVSFLLGFAYAEMQAWSVERVED